MRESIKKGKPLVVDGTKSSSAIMKLSPKESPSVTCIYLLQRLQVIKPAHKLRTLSAGVPNLVFLKGKCVQTDACKIQERT